MPSIAGAIETGCGITRRNLQQAPSLTSQARTPRQLGRQRPKKISVARLPVTGSELFGREEDIAYLDDAWANKDVNVVTIVAWAGVGKSTLINHWLRRMAAEHYRSAEFVLGAMPVSFGKRCTKFTSQESSAAMPTSQRMSSPLEEHYLRYWRISLNRGAGVHYWRRMSSNKASLRKIGSIFCCRPHFI